MSIKSAFDNFMQSGEFESAVDSSTKASWGGGYYAVELFDDGDYQVLASIQIGNLYDTPGLIVRVPALSDEEWDDDPDVRFYENAKEIIKNDFADKLSR